MGPFKTYVTLRGRGHCSMSHFILFVHDWTWECPSWTLVTTIFFFLVSSSFVLMPLHYHIYSLFFVSIQSKVCHIGGGGLKISIFGVTYFLNGPFAHYHVYWNQKQYQKNQVHIHVSSLNWIGSNWFRSKVQSLLRNMKYFFRLIFVLKVFLLKIFFYKQQLFFGNLSVAYFLGVA